MGRMRDETGACSGCGKRFTPTRHGQAKCQQCRRRQAVQRHSAKRLAQLRPILMALENLRLYVEAEIGRWERIAGR